MMDIHDTNFPEASAELAEGKAKATVSEEATSETAGQPTNKAETPVEEVPATEAAATTEEVPAGTATETPVETAAEAPAEAATVETATAEEASATEATAETPAEEETTATEATAETAAAEETSATEATAETPAEEEASATEATAETPAEEEASAPEATAETAAAEEASASEATAETAAEEEASASEATAETAAAEEASASEATAETPAAEPIQKLTKEEILARLKEIAENVENIAKTEIDALKQSFYKLHNAEQEAAKRLFVEQGNAEEAFTPVPDTLEEEFKNVMSVIKEKKNQLAGEIEKQKEQNLQIKLNIIEEVKKLLDSPEDANRNYGKFKKLQQQWNEIKLISPGKVNELWKSYQLYVEKYYDLLKLNNEFRVYDFKKNLEIKTRLCESAEKLADEPDVVSAFHRLQKLHQEFRETGPVAKELREEVWARFKAASTVINRKHQQHFEKLKEEEQHNLDQKTVICEIIEAIDFSELKNFSAWEKKTQEIIALQNKWKTIGFAPQKMNVKIFERFRKGCDEFFKKKGEFFKLLKEGMNENLEKKRRLCEQAEALKESTDWKATADALAKLQKEWKTIGPVAKKYSDAVWKRFIGACDYFFEQKNKATSSQRSQEQENLEKKRAIIEKLTALNEETDADTATQSVHDLMREWNGIGFVPFKEKDKIYKQYHNLVDGLFDRFNISASSKKLMGYKSSIGNLQEGDSQSLYREREKLVRTFETMKSELQTYENNLGFLTTSSKKGNSMLNELNRKVEKLKSDIELVREKIKVIDESIKNEGTVS